MHTTASATGRAVLLAAAAALALLLGAPSAASAAAPAAPAAEGQPAWVRATHLVPDLPRMDIDVTPVGGGETTTVDGAAYGDVSAYVRVPAGAYTVAVRPGDSDPGAAPVLSSTVQTEAGRAYTIAALGTAGSAQLVPLEDDLTPPAAGQARLRVLSAASTAGSVAVSAVNGPTVVRQAPFGTSTTYADVPAGRWTLTAAPVAGAEATAVAGSTDVDLAAGSTYTLAVTDGQGAQAPLVVTPVADAAGSAVMPVGGAATGGGGTAAVVGTSAATSAGASAGLPGAASGGALGVLAAAAVAGLVLALRRRGAAAR